MEPFVILLKALADDTRLKIMHLLSAHDLCVGALARRLGISSAAVSQHLKIMRKAGIVKGEKRGYWTHYAVEKSTLELIAERFSEAASQALGIQSACLRALPIAPINKKRRENDMCKGCCERPEKLKDKTENCTPEQIKECHGDVKKHPCEDEKKEGK